MSKIDVVRFLLRHNTRIECLELSRGSRRFTHGTDKGIRIPEDPERYSARDLSEIIVQRYAEIKPQVDPLYIEWAKALNAQIDREVRVEKVGKLNTDLSKIWGLRVGLKVYASPMDFPAGCINLHVTRLEDYDTVRVSGYSINEAF